MKSKLLLATSLCAVFLTFGSRTPTTEAQGSESQQTEDAKRAEQQKKDAERLRKRLEAQARIMQKKGGCFYSEISPIPADKAVIYLMGNSAYAPRGFFEVNGSWIASYKDNSYFPYVTSPGQKTIALVSRTSTFQRSLLNYSESPSRSEKITLKAEAGREYYVKVDHTGIGTQGRVAPKQTLPDEGRGKLQNYYLLVPYRKYERTFHNENEARSDAVFRQIPSNKVPRSAWVSNSAGRVRGSFDHGTYLVTWANRSVKLRFENVGRARTCSDPGIVPATKVRPPETSWDQSEKEGNAGQRRKGCLILGY